MIYVYLNGLRLKNKNMEFYNCHITNKAIENANNVLKSGFLNQGPYVKNLETDILPTEYHCKYPILTNSCTSALHIALELSDVRGKEVILPAKTFIATGIAVLMAGGIPVFCDIEPSEMCINYHNVKQKITNETAAIIGVSWGGSTKCCYYLKKLKSHFPQLSIIEDAAHSFGSYSKYRNFYDFICYSFQAIKMVTCGDGGLLVCNNEEKYKEAKAMRWFGIDKDKMTFSDIGERQFSIERLGYKYNMNDLNAAILSGNLYNLKARIERRQTIYDKFSMSINNDIDICIHDNTSAIWLCPLLVNDRNNFIKAMRSRNVPATKTDSRIDLNPIFGKKTKLPNTEYYDEHEANIPIHEDLTDEDVELIIESINKGW